MIQPPLYEFGGQGPVMQLALANGFPPQSYQPLLQPFTQAYRVVSLPPRALWPAVGDPPVAIGTWREVSDDLLGGMHAHDLHAVIGVGHSFGAVASLLAAIEAPQLFRALVLLDPTILPPPVMAQVQAMRAQGEVPRSPLVDGALRRRQDFADADEAFIYWRGKPLFADWADDVLRLYVEGITQPTQNGVTLRWPRAWEAYYYLSFYADTWDDLPRLAADMPVLIIRGETSDVYTAESQAQVQAVLPHVMQAVIPGHGHLFPQAAPQTTYAIMRDWLETVLLR